MAENVLGLIPKSTHEYDKYIPPSLLKTWMKGNGMQVIDTSGIVMNGW